LKQHSRRPGSLERSATTPWAYPPGIAESGVGILETLTGLAVFLVLAMAGGNAFRGVIANQQDAPQVGDYRDGGR
jgi:hypothetical protein